MSEQTLPTENKPEKQPTDRAVLITAIVSCAVIVLACIVAAVIVSSAFFANPPW